MSQYHSPDSLISLYTDHIIVTNLIIIEMMGREQALPAGLSYNESSIPLLVRAPKGSGNG